MNRTRILAGIAGLILAVAPVTAQPVADYLSLPGPIQFDGDDYTLSWSSQPSETYTKQEYLPPGQTLPNYGRMLMVEVLTGAVTPRDAMQQQVAFLNERRASDPITNYQVIENAQSDEIVLDFVLSARDANGEYIIEWNGYRYVPLASITGNAGVALLGISHRAYGNDASQAFLEGLAAFKAEQIAALTAAPLPDL